MATTFVVDLSAVTQLTLEAAEEPAGVIADLHGVAFLSSAGLAALQISPQRPKPPESASAW
ncbi:hypothetical protein [Amycolatopsis sp. lyj-23]|uniref:hypothetical protein n=1 Tax=Amycolatopsis sp. lyj-23 TaxID=2789283 RepID=UPI00397DAA25